MYKNRFDGLITLLAHHGSYHEESDTYHVLKGGIGHSSLSIDDGLRKQGWPKNY
jgi:hypothetical protein